MMLPFWQRLLATIIAMVVASFLAGLAWQAVFNLPLPSYVAGMAAVWQHYRRGISSRGYARPSRNCSIEQSPPAARLNQAPRPARALQYPCAMPHPNPRTPLPIFVTCHGQPTVQFRVHADAGNRQTLTPCWPMLRNLAHLAGITALACIALIVPDAITAQGACDTLPAGPARTDCFVGRARILSSCPTSPRSSAGDQRA
jgi:hypothetical protein